MKVFSLHTIHHMIDGVLKIQPPGHVFDMADEHVPDLLGRDAVRDPTAEELALHAMANPEPASAPEPAPAVVAVTTTAAPESAAKGAKGGGKPADDIIG